MKLLRRRILLLVLCVTASSQGRQLDGDRDAFFRQSASAILSRSFNDPNISYLLYDVRTAQPISRQWQDENSPVAMGSLVKPFTALAYAKSHEGHFPQFHCTGKKTCWLPRGHGTLGITEAIAQSCNSYFHQLAADVPADAAGRLFKQYGLAPFDDSAAASVLSGTDNNWKNTSDAIAQAYLQLWSNHADPSIETIFSGMQLSAQTGTGRALGSILKHSQTLVKTGTAPCAHQPKAPGDGFALVMVPAESPKLLLLVRGHGMPGSQAAGIAARMLAQIEELDANAK
jgi:cell division protein FtsI/penicillin-binding protein 2